MTERAAGGERSAHWERVYATRGVESVSWYQREPRVSLDLLAALGVGPDASVIDVGGGASPLADRLAVMGFGDVTLLDISRAALDLSAGRGDARIRRVHADVLTWAPGRSYDVWHDRAVFHFLVAEDDREAYLRTLRSALVPGGALIMGTFAPSGPDRCSGLPVARYAAPDLARLLGPGFRLGEAREELHRTPSGAIQPFTWVAGRMGSAA